MPSTYQHTFTDHATRVVAVATVSGLAALAGWISYRHMLLLARRAGQSGIDAHAFPLTVDGLDLIGVLVLLADRRTSRASGWLPWTVLTIGTLASICANIAVAPDNPIARAISGWTAVALLAAAKMLAHLFEPVPPTEPSAEPATPATTTPTSSTDAEPVAVLDTEGDRRERVAAGGRQGRRSSTAARRIPSSPAAQAKWRSIWHATKHLRAATVDVAASHDVSLRTLQFIRAAGEGGHLDPPSQPTGHQPDVDVPAESSPTVNAGTAPPSRPSTVTGAPR